MMSVGTLTLGTTLRTSISNAIRMNATASGGLAPCVCSRPNQRRGVRACRVHHGPYVVHSFLERAKAHAVGEPHSALVEQEHAGERSEPFIKTAVFGALPHHLEVRDRA